MRLFWLGLRLMSHLGINYDSIIIKHTVFSYPAIKINNIVTLWNELVCPKHQKLNQTIKNKPKSKLRAKIKNLTPSNTWTHSLIKCTITALTPLENKLHHIPRKKEKAHLIIRHQSLIGRLLALRYVVRAHILNTAKNQWQCGTYFVLILTMQ